MHNKTTIASKIWQGTKLFFKWLWLITMFIFGGIVFLGIPFAVFEYSFSLFELDLIETVMIIFIGVFCYYYIKLCKRNSATLGRKIMTPFVHQGHMLLLSSSIFLASIFAFNLDIELSITIPIIEIMGWFLFSGTLLYSYYRINAIGGQSESLIEEPTMDGVTE
ncbi:MULTISPECIES: hypothetical protein [Vibrio]|uniref:Uncharacterized protein n=1 Tax=Vibrio cortegadensis TaxID=1328770 RepID=A0ABV4M4R9_9VIBR|nr:hypothetical protein [Vibrio cortegadensis]MDN3696099.1 hypothetical protein [Vibrio cortegadensis]